MWQAKREQCTSMLSTLSLAISHTIYASVSQSAQYISEHGVTARSETVVVFYILSAVAVVNTFRALCKSA